MAEADIKTADSNTLEKKPPKVPIPTYRWEDVRRSKLKGGYPWTHLYKDPFNEESHPEHYTMEEFRRSKSSSTLARPNTLEIQELPNGTPSEKGSADPIITEAVTPEAPHKRAFGTRDSIISVKTLESAESSDNVSQYLDKDETTETSEKVEEVQMEEDKSEEPKVVELIPGETAAGSSKNGRGERAKSEEPKRKRKLSIDSSYSRISLSKLAVLKKLRDAKDKVKMPKLSFRRHKNEAEAKKKAEQEKAEKEKKKKEKRKEDYQRLHPDKPIYIHIPLKPPPGESDEFSYLEFEEKKSIPSTSKETEEQPVASSPDSPGVTGVQFIVLTPPSDDEILNDPTIPETPSESEKFFDNTKIEELKTLAKNAVDEAIAANRLETVKEENGNGKEATPPPPPAKQEEEKMVVEEVKTVPEQANMDIDEEKPSTSQSVVQEEKMVIDVPAEKMVIDEEDGLRSSEATSTAKPDEILDKASNEQISSQVVEKRLSFRRKFKKSDPERIYEDVQVGGKTDDEKLKAADIAHSMSVDEEKAYLEQKVMNNTSLEEDYNKWSKTNDHEYEPVCPPPDDTVASPPTADLTDSTNLDLSMATVNPELGEINTDNSLAAQELQSQIEEKFFTQAQEASTAQTEQQPQPQQKDKKVESSKFQQAIRDQAGKFKTKIQGIKRPHITMPSKPNFKIEKPKINLPKIPNTTTIHLPSFSLTGKRTPKRSLKEQFSTESNAGDTKKHNLFDFSTYPRFFHKKKKEEADSSSLHAESHEPTPPVEFATVPRTNHKKAALASKWAQRFKQKTGEKQQKKSKSDPKDRWKGRDTIRIPLHSEDSVDKEVEEQQREESIERETIMNTRFNEDIDVDEDAYHKENQEIHRASPFSHEYNSRWAHGTFHQRESPPDFNGFGNQQQVTDLDNDLQEPETPRSGSYDVDASRDTQSSRGSLGSHRRGVVEEISADEFIVRQKGISQDDIDMRKYLSSEIREAFTSPQNVLYQFESEYNHDYDLSGSNQSLPEKKEKREPIKKPKRKKTPHVSQEQVQAELEEEYPLPHDDGLPPVPPARPVRKNRKPKKVIPFQETLELDATLRKLDADDSLRYYDEKYDPEAYENECMEGIEQPEIHVTDPYAKNILKYQNTAELNEQFGKPEVPPRKQKSLKSLDVDSILSEEIHHKDSILSRIEDDIIPVAQDPPQKPARTRSRTRSQSLATSQPDEDNVSAEIQQQTPCVEEPCIQDIRDPMGYAIIDKTKVRDPPLPPPRTPPRRRRSLRSDSGSLEKFATVPRSEQQPVRPLRNYSTLGPSRPPRIKSSIPNLTDEEKETIDVTPYIEIEEEPTRRLQSGEVLQKMKDRPLPAPPRPPRKTRALHEDAVTNSSTERLEESEVSTQTEPLPDDVEIAAESVVDVEVEAQPTTRIINFQTPTHYTHEETVTHGSLIVEPLNGAKIIPDSQFSRIEKQKERIIPVTTEDEDTSEVPEEFHRLSNPSPKPQEPIRAQKLQIEDLDVNRLTVNELLANKISVSQIDGVTIQVNEITSRDGAALKVNEIELPQNVVQQILEKIQAAAPSSILVESQESTSLAVEVAASEETIDDLSSQIAPSVDDDEQKKTSIIQPTEVIEEEPPQRPPRQNKSEEETSQPFEEESTPLRPPRQTNTLKPEETIEPGLSEQEQQLLTALAAEDDLDVDDEPPPRPPNPASEYFPSQPPASFYALRAQEYVQDDIPMPPRRRRQHHQKVISHSSSDEDSSPAAMVSRRRLRATPEPSIPQLTCQLARACSTATERQVKRLISYITTHVLNNADGQQDLHVTIAILLVLIAGLILLGFGEGRTTIHYHHWEFFNPPKEL